MPPTTTTTKDDYVTPHISDERLRRSVMAAQVGRTSIRDVYEREARRPPSRWRLPFKPEFDEESFSSALGIIEVVVEGLCVEGAEGWVEGERSVGGDLGVERSDRATGSLYDPLENLECMFETFLGRVEAWANKPKYFKEVTVPLIVRTIEHSKSEASTAKQLRAAIRSVGPIDTAYVNSFDPFARSMEEPILELRALAEFIASIVEEGDEIAPVGSQAVKSTPQTSSPYLNPILNRQPATQAFSSGHAKNESTASKRTEGSAASAGSLQAPSDSNNMKLPSPSHGPKSKRHSPTHLGPPSYSPRTSRSNTNNPLKSTDLADLSSLLLEPAPRYRPKTPPPPPANTPSWKISLSARKGHPLHTLHVTPLELSILTTCLPLVHKATRRAEECMRTIADRKRLAVEMQEQCKQWEEVCWELEDNLDVDDDVKGGEKGRDDDDDDADDASSSSKLYNPDRFATRDSDSDSDSDNNDSRVYGRTAIRARKGAQRYRKFEDFKADDDDEDGTDKEDWKGEAGFGFRVRRPRKSAGKMSGSGAVQSSSSSDDDDDVDDEDTEVVMRFEEDIGREEHDGYDDGNGGQGQDQDQDREMMDVGDEDEGGAMEGLEEGEVAEEEKRKGAAEGEKKGLKSGGRTIGLYGEEL